MLSSAEFHRDFLAFRISTHEIGVNGLKFARNVSPQALSALIFEPQNEAFSWHAQGETVVHYSLERENDHSFRINVSGELTLSCACVRCLDPVVHRFSVALTMRMLEKEHLSSHDDEVSEWQFDSAEIDMSLDGDAPVGYFSDKCIDLGVILREQIFLQVPDYPQCGSLNGSSTASCGKSLPLLREGEDANRDNPFVKLLSKTR